MNISVVVPLFNEEESLPELYAWIERVMKANGFSFEVKYRPFMGGNRKTQSPIGLRKRHQVPPQLR